VQEHAIDVLALDGRPKPPRGEPFTELPTGLFAVKPHKDTMAWNAAKINTWNNSKSQ
jgi:hypothetical protein